MKEENKEQGSEGRERIRSGAEQEKSGAGSRRKSEDRLVGGGGKVEGKPEDRK